MEPDAFYAEVAQNPESTCPTDEELIKGDEFRNGLYKDSKYKTKVCYG